MRAELVQALALVAGLHAVGPVLDPPHLGATELATHLGQQVTLTGRVVGVDPGDSVTELTLRDGNGTASVLIRGRVPPMGALVEVRGDATPDEDGPIVWARGPVRVIASPAREPLALSVLVDQAPRRAGSNVAVVAAYDPDEGILRDGDASLPVRILAGRPPADEILAWGQLRYDEQGARYRLHATGWRAWSPT